MHIVTIPPADRLGGHADPRPRWFVNAQRRCRRLAAQLDGNWAWAWNHNIPHKVQIRNGDVLINFVNEADVTMFMFSYWCQDDDCYDD